MLLMNASFGKIPRRVLCTSALFLALILSFSASLLSQTTDNKTAGNPSAFPASRLNSELPEWLKFSGEYRVRPEEHTAYKFTTGVDDGFMLSRLRLNVGGTPTHWFGFFVQAQDAHALGIDTAHVTTSINDTFDLRQAYIQLTPWRWLQVRTGRQELRFGSERLIGVSDWTNVTRVFDAIRVTAGTDKNHVDIFTSSVVVSDTIHFDNHAGGLTFHGIYGGLSSLVPKATVEPYLLWKALPVVNSEAGTPGDESEFTFGLRWFGKAPYGFDYGVEAAKQKGYLSTDDIDAEAGYALIGYTLPRVPLKPRLSVQYDYASGDGRSKDGKVGTFDQLYPSNHYVFGNVDLLGWRNIRQWRTGFDFQPIARTKVVFDFRGIGLTSAHDGLYGSTGSVLVKAPKTGALSTEVGHEADVSFRYQVRKNIDLGAGFGHLFAGRFITQNSPGSDASIGYTFVTYKF